MKTMKPPVGTAMLGLGLSAGLRRRTGVHTEPNGYAYRIKVVCIQNWTSMHTGLQWYA